MTSLLKKDIHVHTTFSDGRDDPERVVLSAIEKGMDTIGFSDHSYTQFDESYCIAKERIAEYKECINSLKAKYNGKINILCGIEQDLFSNEPTDDFDFVIGSAHYINVGNEYFAVDESPDILKFVAERYFSGDMYSLVEKYYENVAAIPERISPTVIGHFDLITKFIEKEPLFDTSCERYKIAAKKAADALLAYSIPFEINTGAISRGYRTTPYPARNIYDYLKSKGAKFILSSDSHSKENILFGFEDVMADYL